MLRKTLLAAGALLALGVGSAHAGTWLDKTGDWAIGYPGPNDADLDVVKFSVDYDTTSSAFHLVGTMAGNINLATPGIYVIGANTGTGANHPFTPQGAPNVKFNNVIILRKTGASTVGANTVTPTFTGPTVDVWVPASFLPSTGFAFGDYTFNLWPRNGPGQISDFGPDNSMLSAAPEPSTWAMFILGFALLGGVARSRRRSAAAFASGVGA